LANPAGQALAWSYVPSVVPEPHAGAPPHLWHFCISHYNEKVRWALDHKRWPHRRTALVPGFHTLRVQSLSGQSKLPVLELGDRALIESPRIIEELERRQPLPALFPLDPAERARAAQLEAYFDDEVAPALRTLFWDAYLKHPRLCARMAAVGAPDWVRLAWLAAYPAFVPIFRHAVGINPRTLKLARQRLPAYVARLEDSIGPSGYLVGERFSVADLSVAAVMAALVRPPEFPYPLPEPLAPEFLELQASVEHRAGIRWVRAIYARHRGVSAEIAPTRSDD
jgi:glutathione S-transferase